jgi:hypothetical protein
MSTHREMADIKVWHINTVKCYIAIGGKCCLSEMS